MILFTIVIVFLCLLVVFEKYNNDRKFWTLKNGMTKEEVSKLVGHPDNSDDACVWMWQRCFFRVFKERKSWKNIEPDSRIGFVLFVNNKLQGRFYKGIDVPIEMLQHNLNSNGNFSDQEVNNILDTGKTEYIK